MAATEAAAGGGRSGAATTDSNPRHRQARRAGCGPATRDAGGVAGRAGIHRGVCTRGGGATSCCQSRWPGGSHGGPPSPTALQLASAMRPSHESAFEAGRPRPRTRY